MEKRIIRVGHSPDPDDAFMFYGIAKNKVDTKGFEFRHLIEDIESLNQRAFKRELEMTAISLHAFFYVADSYSIMSVGGSFGDGYGPIVVAKKEYDVNDLKRLRIAVPGRYTTAYLYALLFFGGFQPVFLQFDKIIDAVLSGEVEAGLLIHEGQLTYKDYGLYNIFDVGKFWKEKYSLPLPLGIDVLSNEFSDKEKITINRIMRESIEVAYKELDLAIEYALQYGRGLDRERGEKFVKMYVNDITKDMGDEGKEAIRLVYEMALKEGIIKDKIDINIIE
jgi:1,4-dihydroxy-6-naphthoate synthase